MGIRMQEQRRALVCRLIQGLGYAGALGSFLAAVNDYLWPQAVACVADQPCVPMYLWLLLGMVVCGALAGSAKDIVAYQRS
jgi:hypothetical protein